MYFLYNHGGSENHGCEALVRTISALYQDKRRFVLFSEAPQQDFHYGLQDLVDICAAKQVSSKINLGFIKAYLHLKRTGDYFPMDVLPYQKSINHLQSGDTEISIGGDIYCYDDYPKYIKLHDLISEKGCKSVLLGCSLDERLFEDPVFLRDMRKYSYISARESITYGYLKKAGLKNIGYAPDTAFLLQAENLPLPEGFQEKNTIGLNLSPMILKKERIPGMTIRNFQVLIQSILDKTDCSVALIPHVVWKENDDRIVLRRLYDEFKSSNRIVMIRDHSCQQLKGFISRCRFFVGARTHATIAAYSTCVPTLALGYSIKSRGIALDLLGSDEHFVVPVQKLKSDTDLSDAFWWLWDHEDAVANRLNTVIPCYIEQTNSIITCIG